MSFQECLNQYLATLGCTARELSDASSVSAAVISRYRSGERTPGADSAQLSAIAKGIVSLSAQKNSVIMSEEEVYLSLVQSITGIRVDYSVFLANLHALLSALSIGNNEFARSLDYDPSYISRILSEKRRPADLPLFIFMTSSYVAKRYNSDNDISIIADLVDCNTEELTDPQRCASIIAEWLGTCTELRFNTFMSFLENLDTFDVESYYSSHSDLTDTGKTHKEPVPVRKIYEGVEDFREAELAFTQALIDSPEPMNVIIYSDWPMKDIMADESFRYKLEKMIFRAVSSGNEMHIIHNVYQPFRTFVKTLENWIPIYMTGKLRSYYLKLPQGDPFLHILRAGRDVVLSGTSVTGHEKEGRYYLNIANEYVGYYRKEAEWLLKRALPLVKVFREDKSEEYLDFYDRIFNQQGRRSIEMCTLPIFTISDELLERMLARHCVPDKERSEIFSYVNFMRTKIKNVLTKSVFSMQVPHPDKNAFQRGFYNLCLSGMFYRRDLSYTFEEYEEHLRLTIEYSRKMRGLLITERTIPKFKNLNITFAEGDHLLISKIKQPIIHFVIEYPGIMQAYENFLVKENEL